MRWWSKVAASNALGASTMVSLPLVAGRTVLIDIPGNPTMRVLRTGLATRVAAHDQEVPLLGKVTDLYFQGDMQASVANSARSRI